MTSLYSDVGIAVLVGHQERTTNSKVPFITSSASGGSQVSVDVGEACLLAIRCRLMWITFLLQKLCIHDLLGYLLVHVELLWSLPSGFIIIRDQDLMYH